MARDQCDDEWTLPPTPHPTTDRMAPLEPTPGKNAKVRKPEGCLRGECVTVGPACTEVLAFGLTDHRSPNKQDARRPTMSTPAKAERGAGTGSDLTLGPGSDFGCSAPIHLHPREHRNHARTGTMFRRRPRRRPACPSTQAPRQHRCGSLACRRHRCPHSHPTQPWRRSSRRRQPKRQPCVQDAAEKNK